ncbi:GIY-YIG nuclease family protein [Lacticaseibacillus kribbianus]|uniref:GIY-YIG nuclease family protein n=1 Tax=Lacticaseibacillus kribbianus TaxID=2926292 RepID=UPI001CD736E3|nr:GIY-YIG nuclease family protein [Lacticaseibacillus kribbianus]
MATAKIIELLLEDGTLDGLLTVQDSSWNGTMFVSPRDSINQLFQKKETAYWGVYLLLSDDGVYIGQASELQTRLRQHDKVKDFWSRCVLFTTKDDSLNRSGIDYIEAELVMTDGE